MATSNVLKRTGGNANVNPRIGSRFVAYGAAFDDNAAVTFQWKQCDTSGGTYTNITGATGCFYTPKAVEGSVSLTGRYLKCDIAGLDGGNPQTSSSAAVGPLLAKKAAGSGVTKRGVRREGMKGFRVARGSQNARRPRGTVA